jgi:hypothetical protein
MQSSRVRLMLVALLGVFAFSAVAAAAAQAEEAPFWSINGTRLGAGQTHYITAKKYSTKFVLKSEGNKVIECSNVRVSENASQRSALLGSAAGSAGTNDEVIEFFEGCKVTGNGTKCAVEEPIVTNPVKSELVETEKGEKGSLLTEFTPAKGTQFVTLKFKAETGGECKVASTIVTGGVAGQVRVDPNKPPELGELVSLPNGKKEGTSWLINFPETPIKEVWLIKEGTGSQVKLEELTAFSESSVLTGTALVLLAKVEGGKLVSEEATKWSPLP